jgi:nucleoside-diphosphate-sugar epimerase
MVAKQEVCIVGGSGFIGTAVAQRLRRDGRAFRIVDIQDSATFPEHRVHGDIRDLSGLAQAVRGDALIHLAAVHRDDVSPRSLYDDVNVAGTRNVCAAAERAGINRIVFASSVAVYGFAPPGTDETGTRAPFNDYGRTKAEAEDVLRAWQAAAPHLRSLTLVRPTVVFGPGNRGNVYNLLRQIATGRFIMIGSGTNTKSMAYVGNVADFFCHCLGLGPGVHVFNYTDGPDLSMNQLVRMVRRELFGKNDVGLRMPLALGLGLGRVADVVAAVTRRRLPVSWIRVKKFASTTSFASARKDALGFRPITTLEMALRLTLDAEFVNPDPKRPVFLTE